jgi:DNA modification methylase
LEEIDLRLGDCLEVMKSIPNKSIDVVITSPPYFNAREYSYWDNYESYLNWCDLWIKETNRILVDGGILAINSSAVITARTKRSERSIRHNIPADLYQICKNNNFWFLEELIWEKPEGAVTNRNARFSLDRHPLQWKANPTTEKILIVQKTTTKLNDEIIKNKDTTQRILGNFDRGEVFKFNPETKSNHPAPFPIDIPNIVLKYYTWTNDVVLDPFMGSGTTGIACKNLGRKFIGIEQDANYFEIASKRIYG